MKKNAKLSITLSSINFEFYGRAIRIAVLKVIREVFWCQFVCWEQSIWNTMWKAKHIPCTGNVHDLTGKVNSKIKLTKAIFLTNCGRIRNKNILGHCNNRHIVLGCRIAIMTKYLLKNEFKSFFSYVKLEDNS